uniref:Secreted protein n=1 Tax=Macrostomum lignano TaxID=282301 RepID=A0A1I8JPX7_9PLAT
TLLLLLIVTLLYGESLPMLTEMAWSRAALEVAGVLAGQSSVAEAACLAKGHLCVSFRQCCSGYCLPSMPPTAGRDRPSSSALTTALTTEAAPWKGNLKPLAQLRHEHHLEELALRVALLRIEVLAGLLRRCQSPRPFSAFLQVTNTIRDFRRQPALLEHEPGQQVVAEVVHAQVRLHPVIGEGRLGRQLHDGRRSTPGRPRGRRPGRAGRTRARTRGGQGPAPSSAPSRSSPAVANVVGNVVAFLQVPAGQDHRGAPPGEVLGRGQADALGGARHHHPWTCPGGLGRGVQQSQQLRRKASEQPRASSKEVGGPNLLAGMRKTPAVGRHFWCDMQNSRWVAPYCPATTVPPVSRSCWVRRSPQQGEQLASALLVNHRVVLQAAGLRLAAQGEVRDEQQVARQVAHRPRGPLCDSSTATSSMCPRQQQSLMNFCSRISVAVATGRLSWLVSSATRT